MTHLSSSLPEACSCNSQKEWKIGIIMAKVSGASMNHFHCFLCDHSQLSDSLSRDETFKLSIQRSTTCFIEQTSWRMTRKRVIFARLLVIELVEAFAYSNLLACSKIKESKVSKWWWSKQILSSSSPSFVRSPQQHKVRGLSLRKRDNWSMQEKEASFWKTEFGKRKSPMLEREESFSCGACK